MKNNQVITIIRSAVCSLSSVGFLKFLKEQGFRIIGTDITNLCAGKSFTDKFYKVPNAVEIKKTINSYKDIISEEKARWIISGPEQEILALAMGRKDFASLGTEILHPPLEVLEIIIDKLNTFDFFSQRGIKMPYTYRLDEVESHDLEEKIILKPRKGRGSRGVFITESNKIDSFKNILSIKDYIIQQFIEGEEYSVDAFYDLEGNILNVIPRKRLKTDSGISTIGETVKDENLFEIVSKVSSFLTFIGGNCFQFIKNKEGVYYLTDINPRFGGGSILSLKASKSFRRNLLNLLRGNYELLSKQSFDFKKAVMYRYYDEIFEI